MFDITGQFFALMMVHHENIFLALHEDLGVVNFSRYHIQMVLNSNVLAMHIFSRFLYDLDNVDFFLFKLDFCA